MSFNINNQLAFIDCFQTLSSSLESLKVKNLGKDDFKCLNQEFDTKVLDLVKEKGCYSYKLKVLKNKCQVNKFFLVC